MHRESLIIGRPYPVQCFASAEALNLSRIPVDNNDGHRVRRRWSSHEPLNTTLMTAHHLPIVRTIRSFARRTGLLQVVKRFLTSGSSEYEDAFSNAMLSRITAGDTVWDIGDRSVTRRCIPYLKLS